MRAASCLLLMFCQTWLPQAVPTQDHAVENTRVVIESDGWRLVGDLRLPTTDRLAPVVLLLNKAAGDRGAYTELASQLTRRGIAALQLDLRGHGESTNLGRFVPGDTARSEETIWSAERDVTAATRFLQSQAGIDGGRIGVIGASYSGEEMAEAGRIAGYARAYAALSPGSFSDESIEAIDISGVPWLFVVSNDERYLHDIAAAIQERSHNAEILFVPGDQHATDILERRPDLAERIAIWFSGALSAAR